MSENERNVLQFGNDVYELNYLKDFLKKPQLVDMTAKRVERYLDLITLFELFMIGKHNVIDVAN